MGSSTRSNFFLRNIMETKTPHPRAALTRDLIILRGNLRRIASALSENVALAKEIHETRTACDEAILRWSSYEPAEHGTKAHRSQEKQAHDDGTKLRSRAIHLGALAELPALAHVHNDLHMVADQLATTGFDLARLPQQLHIHANGKKTQEPLGFTQR